MKKIWLNTKKKLDQINKSIHDTHDDPKKMKLYSSAYFEALKHYLPVVMDRIVLESDQSKCIELLQIVFSAQEELMSLRIIANISVDDELREVADDFDNNNHRSYEYLIKKIKNRNYIIQITS